MLKSENIVSSRQYFIARALAWSMLLIIGIRYFQIQIVEHEIYKLKSNTNRIRKVNKNAPRGLILDRDGEILVDNYPVYVLTAIPGEMEDKGNQFKLIANYIESDSSKIHSSYKKYYRGRFIPTRLAKDMNFSQLGNLEENKLNLAGVYYDQIPERYFPNGVRAPHLFGYVKEVDRSIRKNLKNKDAYELGDLVGWSGLEKQYETFLMGQRGTSFYEVNATGREVGVATELDETRPIPGNNIRTTLDLELQLFCEELMRDMKGSILVGDPLTGGVLAAISAPDYSPDFFTGLITESDWNSMKSDPDKPLINRYVQGTYIPGSIVKMITQASLLKKEGFEKDKKYYCPGFYQFGDRIFGCWFTEGHGELSLNEAMAVSCDVYFYKTVTQLNLQNLHDTFKQFGFGSKTNIDVPNEANGLIPDKDYMTKRYGKYGWSRGVLLNLAIGQGELLVTPIQILNYINLLSTKGVSPSNHFVFVDNLPLNVKPNLSPEIWDIIHNGLRSAIISSAGTGKKSDPQVEGFVVYGKTGTAENSHGDKHAWFVGWADYKQKKYSLAILLENAGSGGAIAAPLARKIFDKIISKNSYASR